MQVRSSFDRRVALPTADALWVPSPTPGVDRLLLDRVGDEVARATSLVRFAAGRTFAAHTHGGGEEFLVLDGIFCDEGGAYPPGTYVRNPIGSRHTPFSEVGCILLVKLHQMQRRESRLVVDTRAAAWEDTPWGRALPLFESPDGERVRMESWHAGTAPGPRDYPGGAELFSLDGTWEDEHGSYVPRTWVRMPPGAAHTPRATADCRLWIKTGHLPPRDLAAFEQNGG